MICTISSRGSPLPPGHWCDAFSVTSAAPAVPATAKPTTTAVVEKSTRIFIDITEFLPVACCSVDTRCHGVASCSAKRSALQPACPALHTIQSKVHACGHNLHAPILRPMKTKAASRAMALRDSLEEEILSGQRPPGARLDESKLAQHFGVSRTPVREALRELAAADLVVLRPRQGAVVATVTVTQLLRSEEHTSELQSLMRISYAVFFLKNKTYRNQVAEK